MENPVYASTIRDLRLQVMSPEAQDSSALAAVLSGSTTYKRWVKSLFNHLIMHSSEWEEYARLGDVPSILAEPGISPGYVQAAKKILNTALLTLIKKSSTGDARGLIDNYCNNSSGETNAKERLDFLYQKYSMTDVQTVYECVSRMYSMANASVEEKVDWVRSVTDLIFNFPSIQSLISAVTDPTQRSICMAELDAQRGTYATILLLATSPEQANGILDFVGAKPSITVHEVASPLKRRSERPTTESTLVASKSNHKPAKRKSHRIHNKPPRSCGVCVQNHLLSECPVLKEPVPNAPVFKYTEGHRCTNSFLLSSFLCICNLRSRIVEV